MRAASTGFADVHGARLYYEAMGDGPPVVLVHAGIADSRMWDDQFAVLAEYFRVIRYYIRGFGKSVMPPGSSSTARDLHVLLDALDIPRAALVGLSIGGGIALDFTLQCPAMVHRLVLAASGVGGAESSPELARAEADVGAALIDEGVAAVVERELRLWVDGPQRTADQTDKRMREKVRMMNTALYLQPEVDARRERLESPAIGRLGEIDVPTLVIVGDSDLPDVVATADTLTRGIRGARKVVFPDVAHMVNMERPADFNRVVIDFLRGN